MNLVSQLQKLVGEAYVLDQPDDLRPYQTDWTGRWHGHARAVVFPKNIHEVRRLVQLCASTNTPLVPQGGNTGLVGGAVPSNLSVVLSTRRLNTIEPADPNEARITVGAGVTVAAVHQAAKSIGLRYGVDFAARESATVGGSIATNAGGHHVVRYGMTRQQLLGVEAVLGNGEIISHLRGLTKDNTGYDLAGLLCGSEGTLGVVTKAVLRLWPATAQVSTALLGFERLGDAIEASITLRQRLAEVEAVELMFQPGIEAVANRFDLAWPLTTNKVVLLVETAGSEPSADQLAEELSRLHGIVDSALATESARRAQLWRWRDLHTEAILHAAETPPHKLDITLTTTAMEAFFTSLEQLVSSHSDHTKLWLFGHLGDGNIHVNITGLEPDDEALDEAVLRLVAEYGGAISAEHGIGRAKAQYLHLNRSASEIAAFGAIKSALDPSGILNPGVLLPQRASTDRQ
ncbi:MAG: FAD-binding oxidoreductase [Acidimicrobiia bacterium]